MPITRTKLRVRAKNGTLYAHEVLLEPKDGRIIFRKSPFGLKDEIKAMGGARWHPADGDGDIKRCWSVEDSQRNRFQLAYMQGEDVYAWFDREPIQHEFRDYFCNGVPATPMTHQFDLANHGLTYHYGIWAAEMGVGKTLSAQMMIEHSGVKVWWWVGPKTSLPNIRREFKKWDFDPSIEVEMMTYESVVRRMDEYKPGDPIPQGVIADESSRCKGATSQRTRAMQMLANLIREKFGYDGYVILMSGTPSPKTPVDWWAQAEIAWPGFLKEGSPKALESRLAFLVDAEFDSGVFKKRIGWKDNEEKCEICGDFREEGAHEFDELSEEVEDIHDFKPSINEVALMYERLDGLAIIRHKKDCLNLPEKRYRRVICKPSASVNRVAKGMMQAAPNTITGLTWLRELSDGFQYKDVKDGTTACSHCENHSGKVFEWFSPEDEDKVYGNIDALEPEVVEKLERREVECPRCHGSGEMPKMVRVSREVPSPKEKALKLDLKRCEETGRIVVFAGFTGSIDRVTRVCLKEGWHVVKCDGRGFQTISPTDGTVAQGGDESLEFWADTEKNSKVAFVAHPESGGMSLTLTEARMAVFYSNSFKPEYRVQAEDRIHRPGMDLNIGCEIVDYCHLATDLRVLDVITENRKLEKMTMGDFSLELDIKDNPNVTIENLE